jgi:general secretion pathway protein D
LRAYCGLKIITSLRSVSLIFSESVKLLKDNQLAVKPVASWRKAGVYVTALQISNKSKKVLSVNYQALNGRWLASTVEKESLAANESTYLYVVSTNSFEQSLGH